jgi:hypothetical protein
MSKFENLTPQSPLVPLKIMYQFAFPNPEKFEQFPLKGENGKTFSTSIYKVFDLSKKEDMQLRFEIHLKKNYYLGT